MKKNAVVILVCCSFFVKAQFVNQLNFIGTYTASETDSVLHKYLNGINVFNPLYTVNLYTVVYNTVSWDSSPTLASGILAIPISTPCRPPLISYQHLEITQTNQAPSDFKNEWYIALVAGSGGYVAVCPDYLGLGIAAKGIHPFLHAQSEATAVIDLIRAAKEITDSLGTPVSDQLLLAGFSEGGHATLAAHQMIQEKLDNVMHVTASAALSGPYDLGGTMADIFTSNNVYADPYYLPYILLGYDSVYNLYADDSDMLVYPYDSTLPQLFNGSNYYATINSAMPSVPSQILQPLQLDSMINDSTGNFFRVRLKQNDVYNWSPTSPVRMIYCQGDTVIPPQNAITAFSQFAQNGSTNVDTVDATTAAFSSNTCKELSTLIAYNWLLTFIYQPLADSIVTINSTSTNTPNGSVTAFAYQGEPPYSFKWSNGDTTATIDSLTSGQYEVTITDKNTCTSFDTANVLLITGIQQQSLTHVCIYPNPSKGMVNIMNLDPADNIVQLEAYDMEGRLVSTQTTRQANNIQLHFDAAAGGIYTLRLQSASGKESISKLVVLQ